MDLADPTAPRCPPVGGADDDSPFVRVAAPVLLRMADLLADGRTCLSLADRQGHVVWRWVPDGALSAECDRYGMPGGEHHSGGTEIIADPLTFIAHVGAATRNIKLGAGVVSIPHHDPLCVAGRAISSTTSSAAGSCWAWARGRCPRTPR